MSNEPMCPQCARPTTVRIGVIRPVCQCGWTPPAQTQSIAHLTEADLRRIVREEMWRAQIDNRKVDY